jgi:cell division protein FtsQ
LKFRRPIYRILFFGGWLVVLAGITTLVIAANGKTKSHACKGVVVSINDDGSKKFIEKPDVLKTIEKAARGPVLNRPFSGLNLGVMEKALEANPWIRDAELYFDTKDVLHVSIWEREPFARVFTNTGASFYIDSSGYQLPLLEQYSTKLPVVTGFPAPKKLYTRYILKLQGVKDLLRIISGDEFWNAQIGQIDITPEGKFELVPVIGGHTIRLGYAENVATKLNNLMVFYRQVLPKAGLAKYSIVDVQFEGQVIGVKKGTTSIVDSIQLQKNIEELMKRKAAEQEPDDISVAVPLKTDIHTVSAQDSVANETPANKTVSVKTPSNPTPDPKKTIVVKSNPTKKPVQREMNETKLPKAVMPARAQ